MSGIFISLTTLCRYEGWILSISLVIIAIIALIAKSRKLSRKNLKRTIIFTLIILPIVSFSGMAFWVLWNWYNYGDPLEFSNNPIYSAAGQALRGGKREFLYLQPINVLNLYGTVLVYVFGPVILLASLLGYVCTFFSKGHVKSKLMLLYLFLIIPSVFTITSMIGGVGEMSLNHWFNSRFVIVLGPLLAILSSVFIEYIYNKIKTIRRKQIIITLAILSLFIYPYISPLFTIPTYADAYAQFSNGNRQSQLNVGKFLHQDYNKDGMVFLVATGGVESNVAIESGLSLKSFSVLRDTDSNSLRFRSPWLFANDLVLSKNPKEENKFVGNYWLNRQDTLGEYYNKAYEDNNYIVYTIKNGPSSTCVNYDSFSHTILVTCISSNLTTVYSKINNSKILHRDDSKNWLLNADLEINNKTTFYINSTDTNWLKINSTKGQAHSIKIHGNLFIDTVKITGWDTNKNDYSSPSNVSIPRSYLLVDHGSGKLNINNSEIGYLGYNHGNSFGLTYNTGGGSALRYNKIHDLYFGFYSQGMKHNILIENNKIYNNSVSGINPHGPIQGMTIRHNEIFNNGKQGIICATSCSNILIDSNNIYNNKAEGIMLYKNMSKSIIRNNLITNNREQISVYDSSNNNSIEKNTVSGGNAGIRITTNSSHNVVRNNELNNSKYGIYVLQGASDNIIDNNKVTNTTDTAILIKDPDTNSNVFKNNLLFDNQKNEISRSNMGSNYASFLNNTVESTK